MTAVRAAQARAPKPVSLKGADAVRAIVSSDFSDKQPAVDANDPLRLQEGASVELFPTDGGGFTHKDIGRLVKLGKDEVAIAVQAKSGEEVRVHAPRWNFRIQTVSTEPRL